MSEERKMILQMLKDNEITVDEAERLLDAVSDGPADADADADAVYFSGVPGLVPRRLVVRVTEAGKTRVNLKVPFSLLRTALKLGKTAGLIGAISTKHLQEGMEAEIMDAIKAIDPDEILASLSEGVIRLPHSIIDVEDDGQHVTIVLE